MFLLQKSLPFLVRLQLNVVDTAVGGAGVHTNRRTINNFQGYKKLAVVGFRSECRTIGKFANMSVHDRFFLVEQFGIADCLCGLGLTPQPRNFHSQWSCVCRHNRGKCHFISMLPQHWTLICFWSLSQSV